MFRDALCKLLVANNLPYAKLIEDYTESGCILHACQRH